MLTGDDGYVYRSVASLNCSQMQKLYLLNGKDLLRFQNPSALRWMNSRWMVAGRSADRRERCVRARWDDSARVRRPTDVRSLPRAHASSRHTRVVFFFFFLSCEYLSIFLFAREILRAQTIPFVSHGDFLYYFSDKKELVTIPSSTTTTR